MLAKQATPSRTRSVRAAMALSKHTESTRGLAKTESPTHTESHTAAASASATRPNMSSRLDAPVMMPRLDSVSPKRTVGRAAGGVSFMDETLHDTQLDLSIQWKLCS